MSDNQIYDGYKPVVCEMHPASNSMAILRNGSFIGIVKVNSGLGGPVKMFNLLDVVINIQVEDHIWFSLNDFAIIQQSWMQMQDIRMSENKS